MPLSFVQAKDSNGTGTTQAVTFTSNVTAGDLIVLEVASGDTGTVVSSVTDTRGNTYTPRPSSSGTEVTGILFIKTYDCVNASLGACTITVVVNQSGGFLELKAWQFHTPSGTWTFDQGHFSTGTADPCTSGPVTTTQAAEVLVGYGMVFGTAGAYGSGWTGTNTASGNTSAYQLTSAAGTYTYTVAQGGANRYVGMIATYYAAGAVVTLHFPMVIADTSTVAIGFHGAIVPPKHFPMVIADTSTVSALNFHAATPAPFTVGPTSPGSSTGAYTGLTATQITMPQDGTLQSVSIFWFSDAGNNYILGVYSDNAGVPGTLIATSAVAVSAIGAQTLPMLTHPAMLNGSKYWIAVQTQVGIGGYYDSTGLGAFYSSQPWTGALPATWGGGSTGAFTFSLYATLSPGIPPVHFPMVIADVSKVTALGFEGAPRHFSLVVADTSTVTALGFHGARTLVTRFVSVNGTGGGTSWTDAAPLSIANSANPGDIIYLAGGNYPGTNFTTGGVSGSPVIIRRASGSDPNCTNAPGWQSSFDSLVTFAGIILSAAWTTLDGNKWTPPGPPTQFGIKVTTTNGDKAFDMQVGNCVARNLEIVGPGFNVVTTETDLLHFGPGCLVSGCSLHDSDVGLFAWVGVNNFTIEYTYIYNIGTNGTHPDVAYCGGGWVNGTFRWNTIANVVSEGVFFDSQAAGSNLLFYGNLFFQGDSRGGGCVPIEFQNNGAFGSVFMYHNTFVDWYKSNNLGGGTATLASGSLFKNNLFVNCESEWPTAVSSFNGYYSCSSRGSNPIAGASSPFVGPWAVGAGTPPSTHVYDDSAFASMLGYNPAQYVSNFSLASGSWAAGMGTTVPAGTNTDMFGHTGTNLGAFQPTAPTQHFPLVIADTSTVIALGYHGAVPRFGLTIADTSTVTKLGFEVNRRFPFAIADISTVTRLGWSAPVQHFPVIIADVSQVLTLGYQNDRAVRVNVLTVPPYSGMNQPTTIYANDDIEHRESLMEDGPRVMPPETDSALKEFNEEAGVDIVPPPISKTDLWSAMQTWPL
jgi:hypothetical protein